ncbi:hypothetical protein PIB30_087498 [Stylosanthes scabra]|uniref:Uncharacterized protein n=1 Tax=Stylosanthes scabra TaxID=79078 RepID=A0ABU6RUD2_9FABA|nr:hypothetical protein [Stylosanthes scabra]
MTLEGRELVGKILETSRYHDVGNLRMVEWFHEACTGNAIPPFAFLLGRRKLCDIYLAKKGSRIIGCKIHAIIRKEVTELLLMSTSLFQFRTTVRPDTSEFIPKLGLDIIPIADLLQRSEDSDFLVGICLLGMLNNQFCCCNLLNLRFIEGKYVCKMLCLLPNLISILTFLKLHLLGKGFNGILAYGLC